MRLGQLIAMSCLAGLVGSSVLAQGSGSGPDAIRDLLLRPAGWMFEWKPVGTSAASWGDKDQDIGLIEVAFEARGDAMVIKINNSKYGMQCERSARLSGEAVTFDMCIATNVTMRFDPNDRDHPFKGTTPSFDNRMTAR